MGFYGQVVYEFKKLFSSLKVTKNNPTEIAIEPPADSNFRVQALQPWDELNIAPSNRWIQLNGEPLTKTVTIGHSTPGEKDDDKTVIGFSKIAVEDIPDSETPITLNYGDYIETTNSNYDKAGHSIEATKSYFRLPISATETDVEQLKEDVSHIFTNFLTFSEESATDNKGKYIEDYLYEQDYIKQERLLEELETYLTSPEHKYVTEDTTGTLVTMYPGGDEMPIAETIGPVNSEDGYSTALNTKLGTDEWYSVSKAIKALLGIIELQEERQEELDGANTQLLRSMNDQALKLEQLTARVEELEKANK